MNLDFHLQNLLGKVHTDGPIIFSSNGQCLYSIINNRVSTFDLTSNRITTSLESHAHNITTMSLSPSNKILVCASHDGQATILLMPNGIIVNKSQFIPKVGGIYFSEDSNYLAVTGSRLTIYKIHSGIESLLCGQLNELQSLAEAKYYTTCDWIDSSYLMVGDDAGSVHLFKTTNENLLQLSDSFLLSGLKSEVIGSFFGKREGKKYAGEVFAIDKLGNLLNWEFDSKNGWKIKKKLRLDGISEASCCAINFEQNLLAIGTGGGYALFSLDDFSCIQKMQVSDTLITSITFSPKGDWLALASKKGNSILVWDWKAETYLIKQQGHSSPVTCIAYNPLGDILASGDLTGKVKVWDCRSGTCFITLDAHTGPITNLKFSRPPGSRDPALFTSSLDGTCRAFDLLRYKNFRKYVAPELTGFSEMEIDPSGEIIVAAGIEDWSIYVWNVQTKQLLDVLKSHTAPISGMGFSPTHPILATCSWDKTIKLWDIFSVKSAPETLEHSTELLGIAFRPDGTELVTIGLDGTLSFWDVLNRVQTGYIEGRRDIIIGQYMGEDFTKLKIESRKHYTTVAYTYDGNHVVCGGSNQFLCIYSVSQKVLLKRLVVCTNLDFNGVVNLRQFYVNYEKMEQKLKKLHPEKRGKFIGEQRIPGSKMELRPEVKTNQIAFSPTNKEFAIATNEGILVFANEIGSEYQPIDVDPNCTPSNIISLLGKSEYPLALQYAIRLNDFDTLTIVFEKTLIDAIPLVIQQLPSNYISRLITFLSRQIENSKHFEFGLHWIKYLFLFHGKEISQNYKNLQAPLRALLRSINHKYEALGKISNENKFTIQYLTTFGKKKFTKLEEDTKLDEDTKLEEDTKLDEEVVEKMEEISNE